MKISVVALIASCALAGAALANFDKTLAHDLPPTNPPDGLEFLRVAHDLPPTNPPDGLEFLRVAHDLPPTNPPDGLEFERGAHDTRSTDARNLA